MNTTVKSNIKHTVILNLLSILLLSVTSISLSLAAQYDANEYGNLLSEANSKGFVRVLITLDNTITLENMASNQASLGAAMENKAQNVLAELGQNALKSGYWNNGIGQMGAYVNESGLHILAGSSNIIALTRDVTHAYRIKAVDTDGSLEAIETAIHANGFANVDIFLGVDAADYALDNSGNTIFRPSTAMPEEIQSILDDMTGQPYSKGIINPEKDPNRPVIRANIDRNAFYALIERDDVKAVRLIGYTDPRVAQWPEEVLEAAKEHGEAEILITLRGGDFFSPKTGYMSSAAIKAQTNANQQTFDDILSRIGASALSTSMSTSLNIGVMQVRLPFEALAQLYDQADARILSIDLNKPVAWTSLTNSTVLLNMSSAWNAGYRAAGQNIVIMDSGVRKDHALFTTNNVSRVTYEACFGSNITSGGIIYSSICPSQNSAGDSPPGLTGSGEPYSNLTACNALASLGHDCSHGTHVAGITAGRQSASISPSNLQGVGPDASIVSIQLFSYNATTPAAGIFNDDITAALNAINQSTVGLYSPFTVNMSFGGSQIYSSANCVTPYANTIASLISKGIPVVAATGNDFNKGAIAKPACVDGVIKVSSVKNDSTGTTLSDFANIASQSKFIGPFLLAPGGGHLYEAPQTYINSADRASTTATKLMMGTSQATPHVAGVYAAIKAANPGGISVANATAWIVSTGSIPVSVTVNKDNANIIETFRRVRLPNF